MEWVQASSTNIERFRFDTNSSILEIEFKKSGLYQYFDVPSAVFEEFKSIVVSGGSAGQFFNTSIKGIYRYAKV